jgi:hypothetical protein
MPDRPATLSRRRLLAGVGLATAGTAAASMAFWRRAESPDAHHGLSPENPRTAEEVLTRLRLDDLVFNCYKGYRVARLNIGLPDWKLLGLPVET